MERLWNGGPLTLLMSGERLLTSYIVRVTYRESERQVHLFDLSSGETCQFRNYAELIGYLRSREERRAAPDDDIEGQQRR